MEFLTNKKLDVDIPKFFTSQLTMYESRLSKVGQGPKSNNFHDEPGDIELDELLLRNTYLNGLPNKNTVGGKPMAFNSRGIQWADNNKRDLLCTTNLGKDLMIQKDIKPVVSHKKLRPMKSILKRSNSADPRKLTPSRLDSFVNNYIKKDSNKDTSFTSTYNNNYHNMPRTPDNDNNNKPRLMSPLNKFEPEKVVQKEERLRTPPLRSYSVDTRDKKVPAPEVTNIIIAPNMKSLISNNIKNIYINNNNDTSTDKSPSRFNYERASGNDSEKNMKAYMSNKVSGNTRDTNSPLHTSGFNSRSGIDVGSNNNVLNYNYDNNPSNKLTKSNENQRTLLQNNYIMNNNNLLE
jgi:hypothetical protein